MIKAETHSDDRLYNAKFDATKWFEQSSDKEILALISCGWGGDYPADVVAEFMAAHNEDIRDMFKYIEHVHRVRDMGFECHVDENSALNWIKQHRNHLMQPGLKHHLYLANKEHDMFFVAFENDVKTIVFIPKGWGDAFTYSQGFLGGPDWTLGDDTAEGPELYGYGAMSCVSNCPEIETLFFNMNSLAHCEKVDEKTARTIHPNLFSHLDKINNGELV